jgi:deazaflavin-dependent oxidoreductase (nitroreductase family)
MTEPEDFVAWTISEFRANHGKVGGPFAGAPLLLLHTRGARTGLERVNPTMYLADGQRYLVFASKAGSDRNPDWYHNLLAHPTSSIEVGDEHVEVTATELQGSERDRMFALQAARYPGFAEYQRKTRRVIPVVALTPLVSQARPQPIEQEKNVVARAIVTGLGG